MKIITLYAISLLLFKPFSLLSQSYREKLNVTIFLDLSDRISPRLSPSPSMENWRKDVENINTIVDQFANYTKHKRAIALNESIKLVCHPIPEINFDVNSLLNKCNISLNRQNATLGKIDSIKYIFKQNATILYNKTITLNEPRIRSGTNPYIGSDIFSFFKNRVKNDCILPNHRNILIILSDGYMYHRDNVIKEGNKTSYITPEFFNANFTQQNLTSRLNQGFGFVVPTRGLDSLEVYVIGVAPKRPWHMDGIQAYWSKWFKEMGVKNYKNGFCDIGILDNSMPSMQQSLIQRIFNH